MRALGRVCRGFGRRGRRRRTQWYRRKLPARHQVVSHTVPPCVCRRARVSRMRLRRDRKMQARGRLLVKRKVCVASLRIEICDCVVCIYEYLCTRLAELTLNTQYNEDSQPHRTAHLDPHSQFRNSNFGFQISDYRNLEQWMILHLFKSTYMHVACFSTDTTYYYSSTASPASSSFTLPDMLPPISTGAKNLDDVGTRGSVVLARRSKRADRSSRDALA